MRKPCKWITKFNKPTNHCFQQVHLRGADYNRTSRMEIHSQTRSVIQDSSAWLFPVANPWPLLMPQPLQQREQDRMGMLASTFSMATCLKPVLNSLRVTMMTKQYLTEHTAPAIYKRVGGWGESSFTKVHLQYGSVHLNTFTIPVKFFVSPPLTISIQPHATHKRPTGGLWSPLTLTQQILAPLH